MKYKLDNRKLEKWQDADFEISFTFEQFRIALGVIANSDLQAIDRAREILPAWVDLAECIEIESCVMGVYGGVSC